MPQIRLRTFVFLPWLIGGCTGGASPKACPDGQSDVDGVCQDDACPAVAGATTTVSPGDGTIGAALANAVAGDVIGLASGTYVEAYPLVVPPGVTVSGACAAAVQITSDSPLLDPAFRVEEGDGVRLSGLTVIGGAPGISLTASAEVSVSVEDVSVTGSGSYGIYVAGPVVLSADELTVSDTLSAGDGSLGRGLSVQGKAVVVLSSSSLLRNHEVGAFADDSSLEFSDSFVTDTASTALGYFGRGVHVQGGAFLVGSNLTVSGSHDSGISVLNSSLDLSASAVSGTVLAPLSDGSGQSGDGIALFLGSEAPTPGATITVRSTTVSGNQRAGVLTDGVSATLDTVDVHDNVYSLVSQDSGELVGTESCTVGPDQTDGQNLPDDAALSIYDEPMEQP